MKHLITRASISVVLGFVWITFSLSAFATLYDDGFAAGLAACSPSSGGSACDSCCTPTPDRYNEGYNAGAASCPLTPSCPPDRYDEGYNAGAASCPITPDRYQEGYTDGQSTCQVCQTCQDNYGVGYSTGKGDCLEDPTACGVFTLPYLTTTLDQIGTPVNANCNEANNYCGITIATPAGEEAGKEKCRTDPAACGIFDESYFTTTLLTEEGKEAGKEECRTDPIACGIFSEVTYATQNAIKHYCGEEPSRCFKQLTTVPDYIEGTYCDNGTKNCFSVQNGLYLSTIYDENDMLPIVKDVQMDMLAGENSVLFVLKRMKPVDFKRLNLQVNGNGYGGKIFSDPMGIICGGGDCKANYETSTKVELYAVSSYFSAFKGWSGDCEGETNHLSLVMDQDKNCTATFVRTITDDF